MSAVKHWTPVEHRPCEYNGTRCEQVRRSNAELLAALQVITTWNCPHYRDHRGDVTCGSCAAAFKRIAQVAIDRAGET